MKVFQIKNQFIYRWFGQLEKETHKQHRFTIKEEKMKHNVIENSEFAQINGKRFYFSDIFLTELYLYCLHILTIKIQ